MQSCKRKCQYRREQHCGKKTRSLTITLELGDIPVEPGGTVGTTLDSIGSVSLLAQTTRLASGTCKATALAVLVDGVDDPVDARVVADLGMRWDRRG